MSEKKRKRDGEREERPSKRHVRESAPGRAKVTHLSTQDGLGPVLVSSAGVVAPRNLTFTPYTHRRKDDSLAIALHCSSHPRLDYTATQEDDNGEDSTNLLRHYIAVYDPSSGELQISPVQNVVLRSTLRPSQSELDAEAAELEKEQQTYYEVRQALTSEFGTRKAKKMLADQSLNSIATKLELELDEDGEPLPPSQKRTKLQKAMLETMAATTSAVPSRLDHQKAVDEGKPRPPTYLEATRPADVYPLSELLPAKDSKLLPVEDWLDAKREQRSLELRSRFVAGRFQGIDPDDDDADKEFKILKYMYALLEFFHACKVQRSRRLVPKREDLAMKLADLGAGEGLPESLRKQFSEHNELDKWHIDRLILHILALALHTTATATPAFELDTYALREDLRLDKSQILQYFRELGCKISSPTEKQRMLMGVTKAEASQHSIARLALPLEFPKIKGVAKRKR